MTYAVLSRGLVLVGFVLVTTFSPLSARAETLADTLVSAYEHSGLLDQNRALLRAADENVAQTLAQLRPIIEWSADVTRNFGRFKTTGPSRPSLSTDVNMGISVSWLLVDFGQTEFGLGAAKETVLATRQTLILVEQQVLLRAISAFMNVQRNSEFVTLRENNLRLLREELRAAKDRFEVGEVTRTDVAQAEARLASAQSGLASSQGDLAQAIEEYRAAVGRRPGNLRTVKRLPKLSGDISTAKAVAVRSHPEMVRAQHNVAAAEFQVLVADAAMKPRVSLNGGFSVGEEVGETDFSRSGRIGVGVNGPIYSGGRLSAAKRQAVAQRDAQRGVLHEVRHDVQSSVGNAYAVLRATQATKTASQEQVRAARVAFRGVREEAKLGSRTTLDVLDAEQELLNAQANLISAQADVVIAAYAVLSSMGELTVKDLKLNVQTYDPSVYYNLVKDAPTETSRQGRQLDRVLRALGKQ